jgi:hypothetical protein
MPLLEAPVLAVAWLLSLVEAAEPMPMQQIVPMQQMTLVVLPMVWLLSWVALPSKITTRATPQTLMPM